MEDSKTVRLRVLPTALKVVREKCLDCSAGQWSEVEKCPVKSCPSWQWRFGMSPETAAKHGKDVYL